MEASKTDTSMAMGDHRDLLDIIDSLRSQGMNRYVALPEIIVCGDQSAGKSSVLEAISGMPFPTKDGLCTRFATELVLRRGRETSPSVSIRPGENRYGEDRERLENWKPIASIDKDGLGAVTEEAKAAMSDPSGTGGFFNDTLRIELTGPQQPHLTMVDLPGLFRTGNKEQSDDDVDIVRDMVEKYMARQRSIILTVVSAKYDYVLQDVTKMAKLADPEGLRTMGLITKPDTLDVGSESEGDFISLAQNRGQQELRLGWHVLKNRKFEERQVSLAERNALETKFFSQGLWSTIDSAHCGVEALKLRLSAVLRDQILAQLPSLVRDVEDGIRDCADKLERLGPERGSSERQLSYLMQLSEEFTSLMTQAVEGPYTGKFFGDLKKTELSPRRLRAVVQNRLREFAEEMRQSGQAQEIVDSDSEDENKHRIRDVNSISRTAYVDEVASRLKFSKGRELPGLFNPLIVSDIFIEQCRPWGDIVMSLTEDILEAVDLTTQMIATHITASDVTEGLLELVRPGIDGLRVKLEAQIDMLLAATQEHPITYNPQLTMNVQTSQQDRHTREITKRINKTFGSSRFRNEDDKISINPIEFVKGMTQVLELDMDRFASSLAVDYMEAYYKVALDRFIDDVSTLAIENCLISKLSMLFRSNDVLEMSPEERSRLAGETQESADERQRLEAKRATLETGLQSLRSMLKRRKVPVHAKQDRLNSPDSVQQSVTSTRATRSSGESIVTPTSPQPKAEERSPASPASLPQDAKVEEVPEDDEWAKYLGTSKKAKKKARSTVIMETLEPDWN